MRVLQQLEDSTEVFLLTLRSSHQSHYAVKTHIYPSKEIKGEISIWCHGNSTYFCTIITILSFLQNLKTNICLKH